MTQEQYQFSASEILNRSNRFFVLDENLLMVFTPEQLKQRMAEYDRKEDEFYNEMLDQHRNHEEFEDEDLSSHHARLEEIMNTMTESLRRQNK